MPFSNQLFPSCSLVLPAPLNMTHFVFKSTTAVNIIHVTHVISHQPLTLDPRDVTLTLDL